MVDANTPAPEEQGEAYAPRLKTEYQTRIRGALKEKFGYTNEMQIPSWTRSS